MQTDDVERQSIAAADPPAEIAQERQLEAGVVDHGGRAGRHNCELGRGRRGDPGVRDVGAQLGPRLVLVDRLGDARLGPTD